MRKWKWIVGVMIVAVLGGYGLFSINQPQAVPGKQQAAQSGTGVTIGKVAPAFKLDSLAGKTVEVGGGGQIYVINFWASWCPPCRAEFPELVRFAHSYNGKVQFYAVNLQESNEQVSDFLQQQGYELPVLLDRDGTVAKLFKVTAIPTTLVVDSQGIIRYRKSGGVTFSELETVIKEL